MADETARLARFATATTYDDLPDDVLRAIRWVVLDTLAVAVAGSREPCADKVTRYVERYGGPASATIIGRELRTDPASAAWVNATAGHALDYDDQSWTMGGHPSVVLLPALLALAECHGASGRDLLRAYAIGFETASLVGRTVNPAHYGHGWHATGTIGTVAAACACAALLDLDERATRNAIALGASSAAGLRQNFGTEAKPLHAGQAARSGVVAAELAALGYEGDQEILANRWGFFEVFSPGERTQPSPHVELADPWHLVEPGVATKMFPSCGATHPGIGAVLELRREGLRAEQVERIDVQVVDMTARILEHPRPTTGLEAKFSMEYCLARALVSGAVTLDHFVGAAVTEQPVGRLVERIRMRVDEQLTAEWVWGTPRATIVTVTLTDGRVVARRGDLPPGSPGTFDAETLDAKVADCVRRVPVAGTATELAKAVAGLDEAESVVPLMELLAAN